MATKFASLFPVKSHGFHAGHFINNKCCLADNTVINLAKIFTAYFPDSGAGLFSKPNEETTDKLTLLYEFCGASIQSSSALFSDQTQPGAKLTEVAIKQANDSGEKQGLLQKIAEPASLSEADSSKIFNFKNSNNQCYKFSLNDILSQSHSFSYSMAYAVFEYLFINPQGELANNDHPLTKALQQAVIALIKHNGLSGDDDLRVFNHVLSEPKGIFIHEKHPLTQAMYAALQCQAGRISFESLDEVIKCIHVVKVKPQGILADSNHPLTRVMHKLLSNPYLSRASDKLIDSYVNKTATYPEALEILMLKLLVRSKLYDPEAIKQLMLAVASGKLKVSETNEQLKFFVQYCAATSVPLLNILTANLDYFMAKDGAAAVAECLENNLLIVPAEHSFLEQQLENGLLKDLRALKADLDPQLLQEQVSAKLADGTGNAEIAEQLATTLSTIIRSEFTDNAELKLKLNLTPENLSGLLTSLKKANSMQENKSLALLNTATLKRLIKATLFGDEDLDEVIPLNEKQQAEIWEQQQAAIERCQEILLAIPYAEIEGAYIKTKYLDLLGIPDGAQPQASKVIQHYRNWEQNLAKLKDADFAQLRTQILSAEYSLKLRDFKLYSSYVINSLAYRSAADIYALISDKIIYAGLAPEVQLQLQLVVKYCVAHDFTAKDTRPLAIFTFLDKKTHAYKLISLQDMAYLNSRNIQDLSLAKFKLMELLEASTPEGTVISFNCTELTLHERKTMILAPYLVQIIDAQFTASNIVAKAIVAYFTKKIATEKLVLTAEQQAKLQQTIYQVAMAPTTDITLAPGFKKKLMAAFKSKAFFEGEYTPLAVKISKKLNQLLNEQINQVLNGERYSSLKLDVEQKKQLSGVIENLASHPQRNTTANDFKAEFVKELGATDFYPRLDKVSVELSADCAQIALSANQLDNLAKVVAAEFAGVPATPALAQLLEQTTLDLEASGSFSGKIKPHELAYLLGLIFMDLSSIHALGYHHDGENQAFEKIRIDGVNLLSQAQQLAGVSWSHEQYRAISKEIRQGLLDRECAGQITNRLLRAENLSFVSAPALAILATKLKDGISS